MLLHFNYSSVYPIDIGLRMSYNISIPDVVVPTNETDNLSVPSRLFATAEKVWFAEKE